MSRRHFCFIAFYVLMIGFILFIGLLANPTSANSSFQKPKLFLSGIPPINPQKTKAAPIIQQSEQPSQAELDDPWFFLTYQGYVGTNWKIFLARGYYGPFIQLTSDNKSDIEPSLNYPATRIAFASDREGNMDIFTMNTEGKDVRRLTKMNSDERAPRWSNNGGHLVFYQVRNDRADVYTINPDGTGMVNLTNTSDIDEYYPDWSPDSQQIIFSRYDSSGGAIWLMNSDGSAAHPISGRLNSLGRAAFSPDGTQISFDADLDGDGWNELGLMNADGSGMHLIYDINQNYQELWMNGWWSNNTSVMVTKVNYVLYNGTLYLDAIYVWRINTSGSLANTFINQGYEAFGYFQTDDHLQPEFTIFPLPTFSNIGRHPNICWRAIDYGSAPVQMVKLDKRQLPDGEWTPYWFSASNSCYQIAEAVSTTWAYRGFVEDEAGNRSPMSSIEPFTTFFEPELSGKILDNRGLALPGVNFSLSPTSLNEVSSGPGKEFYAYLPGKGSYTINNILIPGYLPVLKQPLTLAADTHLDIATRPEDDLFNNGDFEDENSLEGWTMHSLTLPITGTTVTRPTGDSAVVLGLHQPFDPWLDDPVLMPFTAGNPRLVSDSLGVLHLVFTTDRPYYSFRSPGGAWATPEHLPLPEEILYNYYINDLVISPDGTLFSEMEYTKDGYYKIRLLQKDPGSSWRFFDEFNGIEPTLGTDSKGILHVIYESGNGLIHTSCTTIETCQPSYQIGSYYLISHDMAVGADDRIHVLIQDYDNLRYEIRQLDGTWTEETLPDLEASYPNIAVAPNGTVMIASGYNKVYTSSQTPGAEWSPEILQTEITENTLLYADRQGIFHLTGGSSKNYNSIYKYQRPGSSWSAAQVISSSYRERVTLTDDPSFLIHIIDSGTNTYLTNRPYAEQETAWIEQTVTIPANMNQPTLDLSYLMNAPSPWVNTNFSVEVVPQIGISSEVFQATQSPDWQFAWLDMSPWKGQTVSLRFKLNQAQGEPYVQLFLDDISLGSWRTPLISQVLPNKIPIGTPFSLEIHGTNFLATPEVRLGDILASGVEWKSSELVLATFEAGFPAGINNLWITNPGGPSAAVQVLVGEGIYLPSLYR
jgi:hypothetical protein